MVTGRYHYLLWAKSGDPPHSLIGHMLDVAGVVLEVLQREPPTTRWRLARALGLDEGNAVTFTAALAASHDLGKATPTFQSKWAAGRERVAKGGLRFPRESPDVPHGALSLALLATWLRRCGVDNRVSEAVGRAIGAHHGFVPEEEHIAQVQDPQVVGDHDWEDARNALLGDLFTALDAEVPAALSFFPEEAALALMALTSLSDWIASSPTHFPYGRDLSDLRAYLKQSRSLARLALDDIGWTSRTPLTQGTVSFESLFGFRPNSVQQAVIDALTGVSGPALIVVEAPMGSGKTEAAFYAHLLLQRASGHRGMYVALPTMATGNGMFPRVLEFLRCFGGRPLDLQLQHGTALLSREYQALRPERVAEAPEEGIYAAEWFTHKKRAMLSEYGVGTVDQALLGVLKVRHHFVRLFGLGNRTVVLDEVHAYDTYTSSLIETLLGWLGRQASSVILMSATLPRDRRAALVRAYGAEVPEVEAPYPRILVARPREVARAVAIPASDWERTVEVRGIPKGIDCVVSAAERLAGMGGCVACVVNTVDRAQRAYEFVGHGEPIWAGNVPVGKRVGSLEVYLFHARYPSEERQAREALVLRLFGREGYRQLSRPRRAILIATQVVEQSLDLDFDAMLTDLAPVDLVLQRAGRLHRFDPVKAGERRRPEPHQVPRLYVAGLAEASPDLESWDRVYSRYLLLRTWVLLKGRSSLALPTEIERLVELVYGDGPLDCPTQVASEMELARRDFKREIEKQRQWAHGLAVRDGMSLLGTPQDRLGAMKLEDEEEQDTQFPLTRYGEPSVGVVLLHRVGDRFALNPDGDFLDLERTPTDAWAERIFMRSVRLSGWRVYRALRALQIPPAWQSHPLLRNLRPLALQNGQAAVGSLVLRLDPELGVVYESAGDSC
ncbi:MAG: CRISPR-associated helicase Cas3' [Armatimonadota bacterium]|nr:CRISPR-associated helicase Cas3' [Armatimonadota bacterium]